MLVPLGLMEHLEQLLSENEYSGPLEQVEQILPRSTDGGSTGAPGAAAFWE